jgi:hypothetical protein
MAGGQYNGDEARTTATRLGWDRLPAGQPRQELPTHCWVMNAPDLPPGRHAGLLLAWKHTDGVWLGQVMLALPGRHGHVSMTAWIASEYLRPVLR